MKNPKARFNGKVYDVGLISFTNNIVNLYDGGKEIEYGLIGKGFRNSGNVNYAIPFDMIEFIE
jgi:hypothetical protein